jgi:hypothetical protein
MLSRISSDDAEVEEVNEIEEVEEKTAMLAE